MIIGRTEDEEVASTAVRRLVMLGETARPAVEGALEAADTTPSTRERLTGILDMWGPG